jgi:hypothetical protein
MQSISAEVPPFALTAASAASVFSGAPIECPRWPQT